MSVSSIVNVIQYTGNGTTTAFAFPYFFTAQSDLFVLITDNLGDNPVLQVLNSAYTISGTTNAEGIYNNGGTINFSVAPTSGYTVTIYRDPADTQTYNAVDGDPDPAASKNQAFDYLTTLIQRAKSLSLNSIRLPDGYVGVLSLTLPITPVPNAPVCLNSDGTGLVYGALETGLPNPTPTTLGGVLSAVPVSHNFLTGIGLDGAPLKAQPAFTDVSGQTTLAQLPSVGANTVLGNNTGSTAVPIALTQAQITTLINAFNSSLSGAVPASGGGTSNFLRADGTFAIPPGTGGNFATLITNLGVTTSVASSAMTIALKQSDGSTDPASSAGQVSIGFRNSSTSVGSYSILTVSSALSIIIPSGATLGQTSGANQYVWLYALNNAGTIELAVSGINAFPDNSVQSTTAITSGSTSGSVLYSTTSRSTVAVRLICRLTVNQVTAGNWSSNSTDRQIGPIPVLNHGDWIQNNSLITFSASFGTVGSINIYQRRMGDTLEVRGTATPGTMTAATAKLTFSGVATDAAKISSGASGSILGQIAGLSTSTAVAISTANNYGYLFYDGSDTTALYICLGSASSVLTKTNASGAFGNAQPLVFNFSIPVAGWSSYGP